jgi:hypothetical protein
MPQGMKVLIKSQGKTKTRHENNICRQDVDLGIRQKLN